MTDFETSWNIIRPRFEDAVAGLSQEQLNWRLHPESLTIGEMALHVAGAEINFVSQLLGSNLDLFEAKLRAASTDGVVNDKPFPFGENEITPELVEEALARAKAFAGPTISNPSDAVLAKQIVSVLGPVIDGRGALARLSFHPGYHQGQAHLIKTAPGFPG
jgi:hypothetical protein